MVNCAGQAPILHERARRSGRKGEQGRLLAVVPRISRCGAISMCSPTRRALTETLAAIKANQAKKEISILRAKIEFPEALPLCSRSSFLQQRFQHVLIGGICFYRAVFTDGVTKPRELGKETKDLFAGATGGMPPTVSTLDSMANEAVRDVREGVEAYVFLVKQNEMQSASKRLAEAFTMGEFMPEIRTLPREEKRKALAFSQKSYQLISAIEVKDYALAEKLVNELTTMAKDFDSSKPMAAVEGARTFECVPFAVARNAAVSGDKAVLETELKAAAELWPRNPALTEVSGKIFRARVMQERALVDFDQLVSQHNYRQIFDDRLRFIAASATYPRASGATEKVLEQMQEIETAIIQAGEIQKRGDAAGALGDAGEEAS